MRNARWIMRIERSIGIFVEGKVQDALDDETLMRVLNSFYGIAHFLITAAVLMWLYHRHENYGIWRTTLLSATCLALIGYLTFPLAPPRLTVGSGIQDMMAVHGAPWSYEDGPVSKISNKFAAMPSLHIAWAMWCTAAIWHLAAAATPVRRAVVRSLAVGYSVAAVVVVVATGNHYFLDVVGGLVVLSLGAVLARALHRTHRARLHDRQRAEEGMHSGHRGHPGAIDVTPPDDTRPREANAVSGATDAVSDDVEVADAPGMRS